MRIDDAREGVIMGIKLITRTDDFGSARAANAAILEAVQKNCFVKNVSCMAVAPFITEGAEALKRFDNICIGVHLTLNSEWDGITWKPLSERAEKARITDRRGCFYQTQKELAEAKPDIEGILKEYDAQLDKLTVLGLNVEYADSHMIPELFVDGLVEALQEWVKKKGLIDAGAFYCFPPGDALFLGNGEEKDAEAVQRWIAGLEKGEQYTYVTHPAIGEDEMLLFYNGGIEKGTVRRERNQDYLTVTSESWVKYAQLFGLNYLKYSQAEARADGLEGLKRIFSPGNQ